MARILSEDLKWCDAQVASPKAFAETVVVPDRVVTP